MKAIVTDHGFPSLASERGVLSAAGFELDEAQPLCKTEDEVIERCRDASVLLVQWAPITRRVLESMKKLKGVVRYGIGVNNIDLEAAREMRIGVANVPTYCLEEVSNHTLALLLALARRIPQDYARIQQGEWGVGPFLPIPAFSDLTLGLLGFGAIARKVAMKAKVFGFHVIACDPYVDSSVFAQCGVERNEVDALLSSADILSLHTPLVAETNHFIRRETIAKMKPGMILINTSRGGVICEADLVTALKNGQILAAGLDVFEQEPLPSDSPLRNMPNVLMTSHAASVSTRAVELLQIKAAESVRDFLLGKRPEGALIWPEV